jgi:hypothetical protein
MMTYREPVAGWVFGRRVAEHPAHVHYYLDQLAAESVEATSLWSLWSGALLFAHRQVEAALAASGGPVLVRVVLWPPVQEGDRHGLVVAPSRTPVWARDMAWDLRYWTADMFTAAVNRAIALGLAVPPLVAAAATALQESLANPDARPALRAVRGQLASAHTEADDLSKRFLHLAWIATGPEADRTASAMLSLLGHLPALHRGFEGMEASAAAQWHQTVQNAGAPWEDAQAIQAGWNAVEWAR